MNKSVTIEFATTAEAWDLKGPAPQALLDLAAVEARDSLLGVHETRQRSPLLAALDDALMNAMLPRRGDDHVVLRKA
ncbi:hypothetical protein [Bradyrhizobium manausense]|uniref:hypothetical protein n=1 Tax=Bradyrhizobium manausense TaxID=989370 RepID=UPI001BA821DB|nr:hypothetical protein [Bradyrhizobium manausense]MBR0725687.1 hypothetical protein [Bradyrhizobium manausense]